MALSSFSCTTTTRNNVNFQMTRKHQKTFLQRFWLLQIPAIATHVYKNWVHSCDCSYCFFCFVVCFHLVFSLCYSKTMACQYFVVWHKQECTISVFLFKILFEFFSLAVMWVRKLILNAYSGYWCAQRDIYILVLLHILTALVENIEK